MLCVVCVPFIFLSSASCSVSLRWRGHGYDKNPLVEGEKKSLDLKMTFKIASNIQSLNLSLGKP